MARPVAATRARAAAVLEERLALATPSRRLRLALADGVLTGEDPARPLRVLDAGCGDGLLTLALARRHPGWSLLGLDRREDLLEGARLRARARRLRGVSFAAADLTAPLGHGTFDAVLAIECLSEIPDHQGALRELAASVAPGGLLILHVPERSWRPVLPGSAATWREEVHHGFTAEELTASVQALGLEVAEIRPTLRVTAAVAQEVADRIKRAGLAVRAGAFPVLAAAVRLEQAGVTGGTAQALLVVARRPARP